MTTVFPNADQQTAINKISNWLEHQSTQTFSLGGLAGTGKSTIIPLIINIAEAKGMHVTIGTPTGKAAVVVNSKLGRELAKTIHSIAYRPVGQRKTDKKDHLGRQVIDPVFEEQDFAADLFIIDEASMVSARVLERLLNNGSQFLFIGDHGQLPPVGDQDISPTLQRRDHTLTSVVRQALDSPIVQMAYNVRQGGMLSSPYTGINQRAVPSTEAIAKECHDQNIDMVIAATNKMRHALNMHFRKLRGFANDPFLSPGETVIITSNSYPFGVFNGELYEVDKVHYREPHDEGEIITVDLKQNGDRTVRGISLGFQWRTSTCFEEGITGADLGYCLTCHKAQGSEAPKVAVINQPIGWMKEHAPAWRYTAVTRAKEELTIFSIA